MLQNILIVDDDPTTVGLLQQRVEQLSHSFSVLTATDGLATLQILKRKAISLILTELQISKTDGFLLLDHLKENYPDIPVIIITAYSQPEAEKVVLKRGAVRFIEKPFDVDDLVHVIMFFLSKETEGGALFSASVEMFAQLIEMEQKTTTIRVIDKLSGKKGVLFFKNGELLNARCQDRHGEAAAYELFSWDEVVLLIEDNCPIEIKQIDQDLQALLFEAMRLKDEAAEINKSVPNFRDTKEPEIEIKGQEDIVFSVNSKCFHNRIPQIIEE